MYVNVKIKPVKTTLGMEWGWGIKDNNVEEVNSSMIYCKNICKCHNVHSPSTTIKKENK
jgi:hypothetical protein